MFIVAAILAISDGLFPGSLFKQDKTQMVGHRGVQPWLLLRLILGFYAILGVSESVNAGQVQLCYGRSKHKLRRFRSALPETLNQNQSGLNPVGVAQQSLETGLSVFIGGAFMQCIDTHFF